MSTAVEIEAAIRDLSVEEQGKLRERLLKDISPAPKTGAELAALWPSSFHLTAQEADDFARDLETSRQSPVKPSAWE